MASSESIVRTKALDFTSGISEVHIHTSGSIPVISPSPSTTLSKPERKDDNPLHLFKRPLEPSREVKVKMHGYEQYDDSIDIRYRNTGIPSIITFGDIEERKGKPPSSKPQEAKVEIKILIDNPLAPKPKLQKASSPETKPRPFNPLDHVMVLEADKGSDSVPSYEASPAVKVEAPPSEFEVCSPLVEDQFDKFSYLLALERESENWTPKVNKPYAQIALKQGSMFNPNLPIVRAIFDMEMDIRPLDFYAVLYDVAKRLSWDSASVLEYVELERPSHDCILYYMQNKAPWPFSNRDFVERRLLRTRINGDIEIYYSAATHPTYPERSRIERGTTLIGGQIFRRKQKEDGTFTLTVTSISQADMKGNIPAKALQETLPSSLEKWYKTVRSAALAMTR